MFRHVHWNSWLRSIVFVCLLWAPGAYAAPNESEPFNLSSVQAQPGPWWIVWWSLMSGIQMEQPVIAQCRSDPATCKTPAALKLIAIAEEGAQDERLVRIGRINRAVNLALRWKEGTPWTTPLAALSAGVGDCKHYAVLKYAAFSEAGFAPDDLRLIIVRIKSVRASHMVLAVRDSKRWLILDSRNFGLVDSRELHDYLPLFSLDRHGIRQFEAAPDAKVSDAGCHAIIG